MIRYQEIRLTHMGLANKPMRSYEPFFLNQNELAEHGRWLFGGLHVFVPTRRDVTVDVLVAWFAELMPET